MGSRGAVYSPLFVNCRFLLSILTYENKGHMCMFQAHFGSLHTWI
jgi:hypothetical protein